MVKLADTSDLGSDAFGVQVRVLSPARRKPDCFEQPGFCFLHSFFHRILPDQQTDSDQCTDQICCRLTHDDTLISK